jgi:hypothetical protein
VGVAGKDGAGLQNAGYFLKRLVDRDQMLQDVFRDSDVHGYVSQRETLSEALHQSNIIDALFLKGFTSHDEVRETGIDGNDVIEVCCHRSRAPPNPATYIEADTRSADVMHVPHALLDHAIEAVASLDLARHVSIVMGDQLRVLRQIPRCEEREHLLEGLMRVCVQQSVHMFRCNDRSLLA